MSDLENMNLSHLLNFNFTHTETFGTFEGIIFVAVKYQTVWSRLQIEVLIRAHRVFCLWYCFQALYHLFSSIFPNSHFVSSDHMPIWKSTVRNSTFFLVGLNVPFQPYIKLFQYIIMTQTQTYRRPRYPGRYTGLPYPRTALARPLSFI